MSTASCCCLSFPPFSSDLSKSLPCRVCCRTIEATLMVFFVLDIRSTPIQREALVSCSTRLRSRFLFSCLSFRSSCYVLGYVLSRVFGFVGMFAFCFRLLFRASPPPPPPLGGADEGWIVRHEGGDASTLSLLSHPQRKRCRCRSSLIPKGEVHHPILGERIQPMGEEPHLGRTPFRTASSHRRVDPPTSNETDQVSLETKKERDPRTKPNDKNPIHHKHTQATNTNGGTSKRTAVLRSTTTLLLSCTRGPYKGTMD